MELKESINDFWFTIEPYVLVGFSDKEVLLYNTLDKNYIESNDLEIIKLLEDTLQKENCGVLFLPYKKYSNSNIKQFIFQLREKFMGDIIEVNLSNKKPIQLLPYYTFVSKNIELKNIYSSYNKNALENLSEISIYIDYKVNDKQLISILSTIPNISVFNIVGSLTEIVKHIDLIRFLKNHPSNKYIISPYTNLNLFQIDLSDFKFRISVHLPINMNEWNNTINILYNHSFDIEYIFDISSEDDCKQVEILTKNYQIENYQLNPIYTGNNIHFFKKNIYLSKEDILSTSISIKDFFIRKSMNTYDFGKLNIMPNGDVFANVNHPKLGNIYIDNIYDIVQKEIDEGKSWFRIRDQEPCNTCVFQWFCPSPSKYEIAIGQANLCNVKPSLNNL